MAQCNPPCCPPSCEMQGEGGLQNCSSKNGSKQGGQILVKQTYWDYDDFMNPDIPNPPKKCYYKLMSRDEFYKRQKFCKDLEQKRPCILKRVNDSEFQKHASFGRSAACIEHVSEDECFSPCDDDIIDDPLIYDGPPVEMDRESSIYQQQCQSKNQKKCPCRPSSLTKFQTSNPMPPPLPNLMPQDIKCEQNERSQQMNRPSKSFNACPNKNSGNKMKCCDSQQNRTSLPLAKMPPRMSMKECDPKHCTQNESPSDKSSRPPLREKCRKTSPCKQQNVSNSQASSQGCPSKPPSTSSGSTVVKVDSSYAKNAVIIEQLQRCQDQEKTARQCQKTPSKKSSVHRILGDAEIADEIDYSKRGSQQQPFSNKDQCQTLQQKSSAPIISSSQLCCSPPQQNQCQQNQKHGGYSNNMSRNEPCQTGAQQMRCQNDQQRSQQSQRSPKKQIFDCCGNNMQPSKQNSPCESLNYSEQNATKDCCFAEENSSQPCENSPCCPPPSAQKSPCQNDFGSMKQTKSSEPSNQFENNDIIDSCCLPPQTGCQCDNESQSCGYSSTDEECHCDSEVENIADEYDDCCSSVSQRETNDGLCNCTNPEDDIIECKREVQTCTNLASNIPDCGNNKVQIIIQIPQQFSTTSNCQQSNSKSQKLKLSSKRSPHPSPPPQHSSEPNCFIQKPQENESKTSSQPSSCYQQPQGQEEIEQNVNLERPSSSPQNEYQAQPCQKPVCKPQNSAESYKQQQAQYYQQEAINQTQQAQFQSYGNQNSPNPTLGYQPMQMPAQPYQPQIFQPPIQQPPQPYSPAYAPPPPTFDVQPNQCQQNYQQATQNLPSINYQTQHMPYQQNCTSPTNYPYGDVDQFDANRQAYGQVQMNTGCESVGPPPSPPPPLPSQDYCNNFNAYSGGRTNFNNQQYPSFPDCTSRPSAGGPPTEFSGRASVSCCPECNCRNSATATYQDDRPSSNQYFNVAERSPVIQCNCCGTKQMIQRC